ncbi:uncharacterized protein SPSK_11040 [Sporothrix schenckii 1099-18]|uniref:Uncharacterized protein n=1 Tax=Sporothrix schenckii 1099-18 TaxID=1397361 RepID=A0A0F2MHX3_SPOSC|nr:uncharacterized protein SPSK_11040 [Sporothrix schenckii 1099-18]KJR89232.1 hypothetical protein SPSK_11040 [Sporothrix schenckii 1099-18]
MAAEGMDGAQVIDSLLTVILTTSPTPSAPSTDLVAAVLASFRAHCPALLACPVIVVFDTYDHIGPQLRLKKGCVTPVEAANYDAYKANVKQLVGRTWGGIDDGGQDAADTAIETGLAEYGSPMIADNAVPFTIMRTAGGRIAFVEPTQRLGFGLAVRTAVRAATTPYVWVQQHDWTLAADIPVAAMLDAMQTAENAIRTAENAVGDGGGGLAESAGEDPTPTKELFETSEDDRTPGTPGTPGTPSTPGSPAHSVPEEHTSALDPSRPVAIRYICLPSVRMLRYATSAHAVGFPTLRSLTAAFKRDVPVSSSVLASGSRASRSGDNAGHSQNLPLTPLFFWHDKTHIAARDHYLRRVFASRLALGRGDFIEDHIGQRARAQMKRDPAAWHRWACWLYYPDNGNRLCLRHLQGRTWRGEQQEQAIRDAYVLRNRSAASAAAAAAMAAAETKAKQQYGTTDDVTRGADHGWHAMPFGSDEEAS